MMSFLLVTDLDNTLVGDALALAQLNQHLTHQRQTQGMKLVYSTGRSLTLYRELQTTANLLDPDLLITAVGTEIYRPGSDEPNPDWRAQLTIGWERSRLLALTQTYPDLIPQPASEQNPFKISFWLTQAAALTVLPQLEQHLQQHNIPAQLIYSSGKDLDILPHSANKGIALTFVRQQLGFSPSQTVACGDSGNDIALFTQGTRGIIVSNAQPELRQWHTQTPNPDRYLAQTPYAAGILEGLTHFGFLGKGEGWSVKCEV
jgi:sucrose-6-phosphatase